MKNGFKKYFIGLSIVVFAFSLSCSKRESSSSNTNQAATSSYNNAQSTLQSIGLAITIPSMADFADTTAANKNAIANIFKNMDDSTQLVNAGNSDTKFNGLESAISDLQNSLTSYSSSAPKARLASSPSLSDSAKNLEKFYINFLLGYYYTVHAVLKLRIFVSTGVIGISSNNVYTLNMDAQGWANLADSGKQAVLDAFYVLRGIQYKIKNSQGVYITVSSRILQVAGPTRCAAYHLDQALTYAGNLFPQLNDALAKLRSASFTEFFDKLATKASELGLEQY